MIVLISILAILFPIFSLPIIVLCMFFEKNIRKKKFYCIIFSVVISFITYIYIPNDTMDLHRYYVFMDSLKNFNLMDFMQEYLFNAEPLMNFIFYIFAKTNDNHLIMIFVTLFSYYVHFYIIFDYQSEKKLSNSKFNVVLLFFISIFLIQSLTGIRFMIAKTVFFLALYFDFYKNKRDIITIFLYILPIFIHQSSIILLLFRVLMLLNHNKIDYKFLLLFIIIFISPSIILNLSETISSNSSIFSLLNQRASSYLNEGNTAANIYKLQFSLLIFLILTCTYIKLKKISVNKPMYSFLIIMVFISLFFSSSLTISTRFITISALYAILFLMDIEEGLSNKKQLLLLLIISAFSVMYITYQFITLSNASYPGIFQFSLAYSVISVIFLIIIYFINTKKSVVLFDE